jgi:membrane-bound ClpP family serine protease
MFVHSLRSSEPGRAGGRASRSLGHIRGRPRDLGGLETVSRVTRVGLLASTIAVVAGIGGVVFALAAVAAPGGLRWGTGAVLLVLLGATWLLCAHAGGHAWFVPLPALALAAVWALTVSSHGAVAGWWLVALTATACGGGVMVVRTALGQQLRGGLAPLPFLRGAAGVAVTELRPAGVVRVGGETWSAASVSGPLPAGAPVHVMAARGVRLEVWSEVGTVPDANVFDIKEDRP